MLKISSTQIQLIEKAKKYINKNSKENINVHSSGCCYFCSWGENPGFAILKLWQIGFKNIYRINVITGKGLRSKNIANPYLSKDLSILRYSVPEFIKSNKNLMKMIKYIEEADNKEGGSGAFNIYLKKSKE